MDHIIRDKVMTLLVHLSQLRRQTFTFDMPFTSYLKEENNTLSAIDWFFTVGQEVLYFQYDI